MIVVETAALIRQGKVPGIRGKSVHFPGGVRGPSAGGWLPGEAWSYLAALDLPAFGAVLEVSAEASVSSSVGTVQPPPRAL